MIHISNTFYKKKLFYTEPQLLRQCKFCNCHHGSQLTGTHYIVCYFIVYLIIQHLQPRCPLSLNFSSYLSLSLSRPPGQVWGGRLGEHDDCPRNPGEVGGVVELVRGVGATKNHTHPPRPIGGDPWRNFSHTPPQPTLEKGGGGWQKVRPTWADLGRGVGRTR